MIFEMFINYTNYVQNYKKPTYYLKNYIEKTKLL